MPKRKQPKPTTCQRCKKIFLNEGTTGATCAACKSAPKFSGPPCKCGCGEKTAWQPGKGWSEYRHGHLIRVERPPHAQELNPDWKPWNYGQDARKEYTCQNCGIVFKAHHDAKFCGIPCRDAPRRRETRLQKGRDGKQYRFARDENDKWRQEHRIVMEKNLGRKLLKNEVVHHVDNDRLNNNISNLWTFDCHGCHMSHHTRGRPLEYRYADVHTDYYTGLKARRKAKRFCRVCTSEFKATIGNQNRCLDCMQNEASKAPVCACGCGEKTRYRNDVGYAKYLQGHHVRVKNPFGNTCSHDNTEAYRDIEWCVDCGSRKNNQETWHAPKKLQDLCNNLSRRIKGRVRERASDAKQKAAALSASPSANPTR